MGECISRVYLLNVPLENDYRHTWYFATPDNQRNYFASKVLEKHKYTDFSYQRKEGFIRIPAQYDDVLGCNYVMYQNTAYSSDPNKWFYAFITDIKYVSDGRTDVYIETDVMQTWMWDYEVKESFVEREHVQNDTVGLHTLPEQLETGEYVHNFGNASPNFNMFYVSDDETFIVNGVKIDPKNISTDDRGKIDGVDTVIASTVNLFKELVDNKYQPVVGGIINSVSAGVGFFAYKSSAAACDDIAKVDAAGQGDAIVAVFMAPRWLTCDSESGKNDIRVAYSQGSAQRTWTLPISDDKSINTYKPRNGKLLTFPYRYLLISNNAGSEAIYKYELFPYKNGGEDFANRRVFDFRIDGALTPGCSIRLTPKNYSNSPLYLDEGLNAPKLPICCWNTDVYTNWLTQNSVNIGAQAVAGIATTAVGAVASASGYGAIAGVPMMIGGLASVASTVGQVHEHSLQPPQAKGNLNSGDVTFAMGNCTFTPYFMSIKKEYAEVIDGFFSMFGYKVNRVKKPNKNHRKRYWYTKTVDVNLDGAIPQKDLQKIKDCYNNGITFWVFGKGELGSYQLDEKDDNGDPVETNPIV